MQKTGLSLIADVLGLSLDQIHLPEGGGGWKELTHQGELEESSCLCLDLERTSGPVSGIYPRVPRLPEREAF